MNHLPKILILLFLLGFSSCVDTTPAQRDQPSQPGNEETPPPENHGEKDLPSEQPPLRPACNIKGKVLDGNLFWAKNENLLVAIVADKQTTDPGQEESHRALEVYEGKTCQRVFRKVLPINFSPDYPYYLSDITYNKLSRIVAIRGFDKIYIFDLIRKKLSEPLEPQYLNQRFAEDAQSGLIQRIELWEDYLTGYATSEGVFVFDLHQPLQAKPVLPAAEYEIEKGTRYNSLFLLKSDNGLYQAILPAYDFDKGEFHINPLFEKPVKLRANIPRNFRNNRYLVIRQLLGGNRSQPIGIDMKKSRKLDIPADVASKKDTEIIAWMKTQ